MDESSNVVIESAKPIDCVYDFSESTGAGGVFRDDFLQRSQLPHAISQMRRFVIASNQGILNLAQMFAAAQVMIGSSSLVILKTVEEARRALGHETLDLEPTDLTKLREMLRAEREAKPGQ